MSIEQICGRFKTSVNPAKPGQSLGLKPLDAFERTTKYGFNTLSPPKKKSGVIKFFECLGNLFNIMLIIASILQFTMLAIDPVSNILYEFI